MTYSVHSNIGYRVYTCIQNTGYGVLDSKYQMNGPVMSPSTLVSAMLEGLDCLFAAQASGVHSPAGSHHS